MCGGLKRFFTTLWDRLKASSHWNAYVLAEHGAGIPIKVDDRHVNLDWSAYSVFLRLSKGLDQSEIQHQLRIPHGEYTSILKSLEKSFGTLEPARINHIALDNGLTKQ